VNQPRRKLPCILGAIKHRKTRVAFPPRVWGAPAPNGHQVKFPKRPGLTEYRKTNPMRRPKGIRTRKSVAKRFRITSTGKVMCAHAGRRHLLQGKGPKRRRHLRKVAAVGPTDAYRIKQNLPLGR
jgi:large subunit ribosomal protein L35